MNRDAPDGSAGEQPSGPGASWLRRLYELESALDDDGPQLPDAPGETPPVGRPPRPPAADGDRGDALGAGRSGPGAMGPGSPLLDDIRRAAGLDGLALEGSPSDHPFGRVVPARAVVDGRTRRVSLRLFRLPDAEEAGFEAALAAQLDRWEGVADLDGVVTVQAAADAPRPWAATRPVGTALAGRDHRSLAGALADARSLAHALAGLHEMGVVHAGIDPTNVVYGDEGPLLDNVGLVDVYRRYADPASVLDPRYAAPEYFESDRGIVDRTTDVYHFGAVLFRLLTGVAPYDGSAGAVREAVLADGPVPAPSTVEPRVPEAVDEVVATATAPEKFERFESGVELAAAIEAVCEQFLRE